MKAILLNISAIVGFIILFEPYYTARINKEKFKFKEHAFKILLGFITLVVSITINLSFNSDSQKVLKEEKEPFIELAKTGSFVLTDKKDTIDYQFQFINSGNGNATSFEMTTTPVAVVNNPKSFLVGSTQTIDLNGLSAGDSKPIVSYVFMKGTPDSIYFYFNGSYNSKKIETMILWFPGLSFIRTVSRENINYIKNIINAHDKINKLQNDAPKALEKKEIGKNINNGINNGIIGDNGVQNINIEPTLTDKQLEVIMDSIKSIENEGYYTKNINGFKASGSNADKIIAQVHIMLEKNGYNFGLGNGTHLPFSGIKLQRGRYRVLNNIVDERNITIYFGTF